MGALIVCVELVFRPKKDPRSMPYKILSTCFQRKLLKSQIFYNSKDKSKRIPASNEESWPNPILTLHLTHTLAWRLLLQIAYKTRTVKKVLSGLPHRFKKNE